MNLLARAKSSTHLYTSVSSSLKHLFYRHSITARQQCNFYATKTTHTKPRTPESPEPPSTISQIIKKQSVASNTVWPRPGEMPYQSKVANFVNLIGNVKLPVQFESDSDGKHFATTVISLGNVDEKNPLLIPVVFEGDLAHIVACHVKEDDCVFLSGQLSADPLRLVSIENVGKFHIVAENLNFVEGLEMSSSALETDKLDNGSSIVSSCNPLPESATLELGNGGFSPEKGGCKIGESAAKKKDYNKMWDLWRDLVKNPLQWYDYRKHKTNGLVTEKFPDFKQKGSGEPLWITTAPKWVFPGLGELECDIEDLKPKQVEGGKNPRAKLEDSWKNLVENPNKWWDNRVTKKNPKGPDFKHKETGAGLWLNSSPVWALSKLPPVKAGPNNTT